MSYADMMNRLEAVAFARDARNHRAPTKEDLVVQMPDGSTFQLPTHKEVCSVCGGEGQTVNPSIDCNGLSQEDLSDDPDFAEDYMSGKYDVTCGCCGGLRVVDAVDWSKVPTNVRRLYQAAKDQERRDFEEQLSEIRFGC